MASVLISNAQQISSPQLLRKRHHSPKPVSTRNRPSTPMAASTPMPNRYVRRTSAVATLTRPARPTLIHRMIGERTDTRPPMIKHMQSPGVAASRTARALTGVVGCGCWPYGAGPNHSGVPGVGKLLGVGLVPVRTAMGCSGCRREAPGGGVQPAALGWPVGAAQCTAPQAESDVIVLDTRANGSCGSRGSSRTGVRVDKGATGPSGESKAGRLLGAHAATCAYGGATSNGGASGFWKSQGRSMGAYSGPSSHVAMQSS